MRVHYWELSNYNNGELIGKWFDIDNVSKEEHEEEVKEWLEELTASTGSLCEEWILGDTEEVPECFVGTYGLDSELFDAIEYANDNHITLDVVCAGLAIGIELEEIQDRYRGEFSSDEEFAEEYLADCGMLDEVPEGLRSYFDVKAYARDMMINDASSQGGHYFWNY